jgi:pyruvate dehydrogenase E2 component (dihydrolipoamide acetyltransferase)
MSEGLTFTMPSLGADMEAGTLVAWNVSPGQRVHRGDVVAVVETHKGAIDVEIFVDGIVRRLVVEPGTEVPVGTVLAELDPLPEATQAAIAPAPARPTPLQIPAATSAGQVRASPAARRLAHELGVPLAGLAGSGLHGAVTRADVERLAHPPVQAPVQAPVQPPAERPPASSMRQAIAAAMTRSNREIPHYYLVSELDLALPLRRLAEHNAARPPQQRVLPGVLLIYAVARALRGFPDLNGSWEDGAYKPAAGIHPGIAISLRGGGVVTPALHDADKLSLEQLMAALADLVSRARSGHLRSSELGEATMTITSLGEESADAVFGVIFPPQVLLVGFGQISERPVAVDGMLAVRPGVTVTLAGDHRASDGHRGARFLRALERALQETP